MLRIKSVLETTKSAEAAACGEFCDWSGQRWISADDWVQTSAHEHFCWCLQRRKTTTTSAVLPIVRFSCQLSSVGSRLNFSHGTFLMLPR